MPPLFPGSANGAAIDQKIECGYHERELNNLGCNKIEDVGLHSWHKGAHTCMNSGSTAGPSVAATCIRGGHTVGAVGDNCVLHAKAGDH
jgi:hypothetical protein